MLPDRIKIGACTWCVIRTEVPDDEMGHTECENHTIFLSDKLNEEAAETVLVHELLHACLYASGIDEGDRLTEEDFVNRVAYLLHATLKDNGFWRTV